MRLFHRSVTRSNKVRWGGLIGLVLALSVAPALSAASDPAWQSSAANLADQIAAILHSSQAHITVQNISSISADDVPLIRRSIEQALKTHGISSTSNDSPAEVRVTLSENARQRLWVAEIAFNGETRIVMVPLPSEANSQGPSGTELTLHRQPVATAPQLILAGMETPSGFLALEPDQLVLFSNQAQPRTAPINLPHPLTRDPRGVLSPSGSNAFTAWLPGIECAGTFPDAEPTSEWKVQCQASDNPWPLANQNSNPPDLRAFYSSNRNFFTGVTVPRQPLELPTFYSAAAIQIPGAEKTLLLTTVDNKTLLLDKDQLRPVTGTRDWGSDIAVLVTGCGTGTQVVTSAANPGTTDSLRAFNLAGTDATPASAPLPVNGTVIALWPAPDGKAVFATIHHTAIAGTAESYEVDRVTASCN